MNVNPIRSIRLSGDKEKARNLLPECNRLLFQLNLLKQGGNPLNQLSHTFNDGSTITVKKVGVLDILYATSPFVEQILPVETELYVIPEIKVILHWLIASYGNKQISLDMIDDYSKGSVIDIINLFPKYILENELLIPPSTNHLSLYLNGDYWYHLIDMILGPIVLNSYTEHTGDFEHYTDYTLHNWGNSEKYLVNQKTLDYYPYYTNSTVNYTVPMFTNTTNDSLETVVGRLHPRDNYIDTDIVQSTASLNLGNIVLDSSSNYYSETETHTFRLDPIGDFFAEVYHTERIGTGTLGFSVPQLNNIISICNANGDFFNTLYTKRSKSRSLYFLEDIIYYPWDEPPDYYYGEYRDITSEVISFILKSNVASTVMASVTMNITNESGVYTEDLSGNIILNTPNSPKCKYYNFLDTGLDEMLIEGIVTYFYIKPIITYDEIGVTLPNETKCKEASSMKIIGEIKRIDETIISFEKEYTKLSSQPITNVTFSEGTPENTGTLDFVVQNINPFWKSPAKDLTITCGGTDIPTINVEVDSNTMSVNIYAKSGGSYKLCTTLLNETLSSETLTYSPSSYVFGDYTENVSPSFDDINNFELDFAFLEVEMNRKNYLNKII